MNKIWERNIFQTWVVILNFTKSVFKWGQVYVPRTNKKRLKNAFKMDSQGQMIPRLQF